MKKEKKIDLNEVVRFHENDVRAGTLLIAEGFGRRHNEVKKIVEKYRVKFENFSALKADKYKSTGGRPVEEYLLTRKQATFLATLFRNNDRVVDFKELLVKRFFELEDTLTEIRKQKNDPEYIRTRLDGKIPRRFETDVLNRLVPYSVSQGSAGYLKNPQNCYINYSSMLNANLFIIAKGFKDIRNSLNKKQLRHVAVAEDIIADLIMIKMAEGMHYKEIYKEAKKKIIAYAEIVGKTKVPFQINYTPPIQIELLN